MTDSQTTLDHPPTRGFFRSLGPAFIIACVVLGPGSILTSSKVGCQFQCQLVWVLVGAGLLMVGAVATAARLGVTLQDTVCTELARRLGRPWAALAGISVFLIAACFQFGNNLGVLAAVEPFATLTPSRRTWILLALNLMLIASLYGLKRLYVPLERLMMILVGLMLIGFAANLCLARPSLFATLRGFLPSIPADAAGGFLPHIEQMADGRGSRLVDPWLAVQGLVATTFSIAGAFYQAYLVREKGWTSANLKQGRIDSWAGITVLVGVSLMIMMTSAAVLAGNVEPAELRSVADVARQLEPLFGSTATILFCVGIFAGAFSSFLVNSIVGGTMLADGLGLDARLDSRWTKLFSVVVLLLGMSIALATSAEARVPLIIFAQAVTVLGGPVLAISLLYLATLPDRTNGTRTPAWMLLLTTLGCFVVLVLAVRTAWRIYLTITM